MLIIINKIKITYVFLCLILLVSFVCEGAQQADESSPTLDIPLLVPLKNSPPSPMGPYIGSSMVEAARLTFLNLFDGRASRKSDQNMNKLFIEGGAEYITADVTTALLLTLFPPNGDNHPLQDQVLHPNNRVSSPLHSIKPEQLAATIILLTSSSDEVALLELTQNIFKTFSKQNNDAELQEDQINGAQKTMRDYYLAELIRKKKSLFDSFAMAIENYFQQSETATSNATATVDGCVKNFPELLSVEVIFDYLSTKKSKTVSQEQFLKFFQENRVKIFDQFMEKYGFDYQLKEMSEYGDIAPAPATQTTYLSWLIAKAHTESALDASRPKDFVARALFDYGLRKWQDKKLKFFLRSLNLKQEFHNCSKTTYQDLLCKPERGEEITATDHQLLVAWHTYGSSVPPEIIFGTAYCGPKRGNLRFSDCVETAIFSMLVNLSYTLSGGPSFEPLIKLNGPLTDFFEKLNYANITSPDIKNEWATLMSNIAGVKYCKNRGDQSYEIKSDLVNVARILNYLSGKDISFSPENFEEGLKGFFNELAVQRLTCEILKWGDTSLESIPIEGFIQFNKPNFGETLFELNVGASHMRLEQHQKRSILRGDFGEHLPPHHRVQTADPKDLDALLKEDALTTIYETSPNDTENMIRLLKLLVEKDREPKLAACLAVRMREANNASIPDQILLAMKKYINNPAMEHRYQLLDGIMPLLPQSTISYVDGDRTVLLDLIMDSNEQGILERLQDYHWGTLSLIHKNLTTANIEHYTKLKTQTLRITTGSENFNAFSFSDILKNQRFGEGLNEIHIAFRADNNPGGGVNNPKVESSPDISPKMMELASFVEELVKINYRVQINFSSHLPFQKELASIIGGYPYNFHVEAF